MHLEIGDVITPEGEQWPYWLVLDTEDGLATKTTPIPEREAMERIRHNFSIYGAD